MPLTQETFRADCVSWNGYKPCLIQKAESRPDCFGCDQYEMGPILYDVENQTFDIDTLKSAATLGVVEMGGLGSLLRTSAVTHAIREINPSVAITWFTHRRGAELLKYVPGVAGIDVESMSADDQQRLVTELDVLINFELADPAKDIVAKARVVGGFALNAQGKFFGILPYAEYMQRLQIDDNFRKRNTLTMQEILLRTIGLENHEAQYDVDLGAGNYERADGILREAFGEERPAEIIGLNIGTSEKGKLRRWPAERHAALAQKLGELYPDKGVVILSGPQDDETRSHVMSGITSEVPNLAVLPNNIEVGDFIALLSKLRVVVTSDTFGLHAALSQNIPTVALAGPMPHRELELSSKDKLVGPKTSCSPCYNRCSQVIIGQCMKDIEVEHVAEQVGDLLAQGNRQA